MGREDDRRQTISIVGKPKEKVVSAHLGVPEFVSGRFGQVEHLLCSRRIRKLPQRVGLGLECPDHPRKQGSVLGPSRTIPLWDKGPLYVVAE